MAEEIVVEVVYAEPDRQFILSVTVPVGSSLDAVLGMPEVIEHWPQLDLAHMPVGVFGKVVEARASHVMQAGERIEIYRPLVADPKEIRRLRAAKAARDRAKAAG